MGQSASYSRTHQLFVFPGGREVPQDWIIRLQRMDGVSAVAMAWPVYPGEESAAGPSVMPYACPHGIATSTVPSVPLVMTNADVVASGIYARVAFSSAIGDYDAALAVVSNLGLRLADPCLEQSNGYPIPSDRWHAAGQEVPFETQRTLIVGTTLGMTSTWWQQQLCGTRGVSAIEAPYQPAC